MPKEEAKTSNRKGIIIGSVVAIVVLAAIGGGIGGYFASKRNNDNSGSGSKSGSGTGVTSPSGISLGYNGTDASNWKLPIKPFLVGYW